MKTEQNINPIELCRCEYGNHILMMFATVMAILNKV